jgi:hypothetical protein
MSEPRPLVTIEVPWAWRSNLRFPPVSLYDSRSGWNGRDDYVVNLGDNDHSYDLLASALPGYGLAVAGLPGRHPLRARSNYRPWVLPHHWDVYRRSRLEVLDKRLRECRLANVRPDEVFRGADLILHVRPFEFTVRFQGSMESPRGGLGLVGVEFRDLPSDWTPVPDFRKAPEAS